MGFEGRTACLMCQSSSRVLCIPRLNAAAVEGSGALEECKARGCKAGAVPLRKVFGGAASGRCFGVSGWFSSGCFEGDLPFGSVLTGR